MRTQKISPSPVKHLPQRTCLGCRQVKAKRELLRLVRVSDEEVEVDVSGKKAGRGAYLCPTPQCWESGLKGSQLEHVLKMKLTPSSRERLVRFGRDLLKEQSGGQGA